MHRSAVNAALIRCRAMVSRKKAKGKARRKAAAKAKAVEESAAFKTDSGLAPLIKRPCFHGCNDNKFDESHDCQKFMDDMVDVFCECKTMGTIHYATSVAAQKYPEILNDPAKLKWIASIFVSNGVDSLLSSSPDGLYICCTYYAEWIHQHVACALNKSAPIMYNARLDELLVAGVRRNISYLKKRIPCSCLDALYEKMKHLPKMGLCGGLNCSHPDNKVEIDKMWSCEACRRGHYCSKESQADHWPSHKEECKVWSEWEAAHGSSSQTE